MADHDHHHDHDDDHHDDHDHHHIHPGDASSRVIRMSIAEIKTGELPTHLQSVAERRKSSLNKRSSSFAGTRKKSTNHRMSTAFIRRFTQDQTNVHVKLASAGEFEKKLVFRLPDAPGRTTSRLERLMGSDKICLLDYDWVRELETRVCQEDNKEWAKKANKRKNAEHQRFRHLIINGIVPPSDDTDPDVLTHPVFRVNQVMERLNRMGNAGGALNVPKDEMPPLTLIDPFAEDDTGGFFLHVPGHEKHSGLHVHYDAEDTDEYYKHIATQNPILPVEEPSNLSKPSSSSSYKRKSQTGKKFQQSQAAKRLSTAKSMSKSDEVVTLQSPKSKSFMTEESVTEQQTTESAATTSSRRKSKKKAPHVRRKSKKSHRVKGDSSQASDMTNPDDDAEDEEEEVQQPPSESLPSVQEEDEAEAEGEEEEEGLSETKVDFAEDILFSDDEEEVSSSKMKKSIEDEALDTVRSLDDLCCRSLTCLKERTGIPPEVDLRPWEPYETQLLGLFNDVPNNKAPIVVDEEEEDEDEDVMEGLPPSSFEGGVEDFYKVGEQLVGMYNREVVMAEAACVKLNKLINQYMQGMGPEQSSNFALSHKSSERALSLPSPSRESTTTTATDSRVSTTSEARTSGRISSEKTTRPSEETSSSPRTSTEQPEEEEEEGADEEEDRENEGDEEEEEEQEEADEGEDKEEVEEEEE